MKTLITISVAVSMAIAPAVVFHVGNGTVKMNSITIKQNTGSLHVRPAGVVIRPH